MRINGKCNNGRFLLLYSKFPLFWLLFSKLAMFFLIFADCEISCTAIAKFHCMSCLYTPVPLF